MLGVKVQYLLFFPARRDVLYVRFQSLESIEFRMLMACLVAGDAGMHVRY